MESQSQRVAGDDSFTAWLYRPYVDLGPRNDGPSHIYCVEFAFRNLLHSGERCERPQRVLPHSFRESLLREANLPAYRVTDPLNLPTEFRSARWQLMCDYLAHFAGLNRCQQADVMALLSSLCFYPAVATYVLPISAEELSSNESSTALAYARANARFMLNQDYDTPYDIGEFEAIATNAPPGSIFRFNSLVHLIVQSARFTKDVDAVEHWASVALKEMDQFRSASDEFTFTLMMSRYYRAAAFAPQMRGDRAQLVREMDFAEEYAVALQRDTEVRRILADENLHPLMQSRTKEALWLGELDLAEHRARRAIEIDPLDPRARMEVGEVLVSLGKIAEAATFYRSAAELGPPGTAIAWYMAGECYETLGDLDHACDCFVSALRIDPLGISAANRLADLTKRTGNPALNCWAELRLGELKRYQSERSN